MVIAAVFSAGSFFVPIDSWLKSLLFINQKVLETEESYYGNITVCENAGQYSFFDNGSLLFTSENIVNSEEYVHYAMLQCNNPKKVLLISGGISGMLNEILKYPTVTNIDYVELNPMLISTAKKYVTLPSDPRINLIYSDGRRFIQNTSSKYDVIILVVPDPTSFQYNRYYSVGFLNRLKRIMTKKGVAIVGISSAGDYIDKEKMLTESTVYATIRSVFQEVKLIPGSKDFYLMSDSTLHSDIANLAAKSGINTSYVNQYYLDDFLIKQRQSFILNNLDTTVSLNTDIRPVPVFFHSLQFLSQFKTGNQYVLLLPIIILLLPLLFFSKTSTAMYTAGFTASSFEMMMIFTFQTLFGYVYSAIGIIVAIFMAGLAIGSIWGKNNAEKKWQLPITQISLIILSLGFTGIWHLLQLISGEVLSFFVFYGYILVLAILTGLIYVICTKTRSMNNNESAKQIYAADLIGSATGALAITVVMVPLLGLINSSLIIAGLNVIALIKGNIKK